MNGVMPSSTLQVRDGRKRRASSGYLSMQETSCNQSQLTLNDSHCEDSNQTPTTFLEWRQKVKVPIRDEEVAYIHTVLSPPEGGWGWVVVGASAFVFFLTMGISSVSGIILVFVKKEYPDDTTAAIWIVGTLHSMSMVFVPIGRIICRQFGWRTTLFLGSSLCFVGYLLSFSANSVRYLILTAGVMEGVGNALCLTTCELIIGQYFYQNWTIASTLALCGAGVGLIVFPVVVQRLLQDYGLNWTYLILSGVFVCQYAALPALDPAHKHYTVRYFKSSEQELDPAKDYSELPMVVPASTRSRPMSRIVQDTLQDQSERGVNVLKLFREEPFCLLMISVVLVGSCFPLLLVHLPCNGMQGPDYQDLSLAGALFLLGLLLTTISFERVETFYAYVAAAGVLACATMSVPLLWPQVTVCIALMGLGIGAWGCVLPRMVRETVGSEMGGSAVDVVMVLQGVFCLFVLAVAGSVKENVNGWLLYYISGACALVGFLSTAIVRLRARKNAKDWNVDAPVTTL